MGHHVSREPFAKHTCAHTHMHKKPDENTLVHPLTYTSKGRERAESKREREREREREKRERLKDKGENRERKKEKGGEAV